MNSLHTHPKTQIVPVVATPVNPEQRSTAMRSAAAELRHALVVTVFTIVALCVMAYFRPAISTFLATGDTYLDHPRTFQPTTNGGHIRYLLPARASTPEESTQQKTMYLEDLEILARRFRLGNFEMVTMPVSRNSPETLQMIEHKEHFVYSTGFVEGGARMEITSTNPQAVQVLHQYLSFLEKGWKVRSK